MKLSPEEMRAAGYAAVDRVIAHMEELHTLPARQSARRVDLDQWHLSIPETGRPFAEVLAQVQSEALRYIALPSHPRFFAFVPGSGNFIGAIADFLAHGYNVFAGNWFSGAGAAMVEVATIDWIRGLAGFPETTAGLFVSGGSLANLTALTVAREQMLGEDRLCDGVIYYSDQTHYSMDRAVRMLGLARRQVRKLRSDAGFRLPLGALKDAIAEDREAGRLPFCVVANAGTVNTGAVDPLPELVALCREESMWLHVDGAYGAAAVVCGEGRALLTGIGEADSLTLDPHKWLFQPFDCGCVLVRDGDALLRTFHNRPEYLKDVGDDREEPNFLDYGPELTRPFRALKLWMTLQVHGVDAVRRGMEKGFHLARLIEAEVRRMDGWEVFTPAQMGMVSFRYRPASVPDERIGELNREIGLRVTNSGFAVVLSTELNGNIVLRMCPMNWRTTEEDILSTMRALDQAANDIGDNLPTVTGPL